MKNQLLVGIALLALLLFCGSFSRGAYDSGEVARTGAPSSGGGTEQTCSGCHNGGVYGEPQISVAITELGGGPNRTTFVPGAQYQITVSVAPELGSPAAYGFQSQFLDQATVGSEPAVRPRAGRFVSTTDDVRTTVATDGVTGVEREYIEQSLPSTTGTFSFVWEAPDASVQAVDYYVTGNSVNGADGQQGDNGSTSPTIVTLTQAALPLDLLDFAARPGPKQIELRWTTENESGTDRFTVERSADGQVFTEIGTVTAAGDAREARAYAFADPAPLPHAYYRLRMLDLDGSYTFSPVVEATAELTDLRAFPNPVTDHFTLQLPTAPATPVTVEVYDAAGTQVRRVVETEQGAMRVDVRGLAPGVYVVRVPELGRVTRVVVR